MHTDPSPDSMMERATHIEFSLDSLISIIVDDKNIVSVDDVISSVEESGHPWGREILTSVVKTMADSGAFDISHDDFTNQMLLVSTCRSKA